MAPEIIRENAAKKGTTMRQKGQESGAKKVKKVCSCLDDP